MPDYGYRGRTEPTTEFPKGVSKGLDTLDLSGRVVERVGIEADQTEGASQLFRCSISGCGKTFKAKHLAASHFRGKHKELNVEKESWRGYVDPV